MAGPRATGRPIILAGVRTPSPGPDAPIAARLRGVASSPVREILALTEKPGVLSFAGGLPAPELFDHAGIAAAFATALEKDNAGRSLQYSTTEGDPELRRRVADRLSLRGLPTGPDDLLITSGSQQALTLIATVFLEPGDRILVEDARATAEVLAEARALVRVSIGLSSAAVILAAVTAALAL